ncbi:MAG: hypothetical protein OEY64_11615 [Nitrospinota bacterium]|nr:hypothetical protein [Nitrospinota bacterium]
MSAPENLTHEESGERAEKTSFLLKVAVTLFLLAVSLFAIAALYAYRAIDADMVKDKIETLSMEEIGLDLRIGSLEFEYPTTLYLNDTRIFTVDGELKLGDIEAHLLINSILRGAPAIRINSKAGEGFVSADFGVEFDHARFQLVHPSMNLRVYNYPIASLFSDTEGVPLPVDGKLSGDGTFQLSKADWERSSGKFMFRIFDISLDESLFSSDGGLKEKKMKELSFSEANCTMVLDGGRIRTENCVIESSHAEMELVFSEKLYTIMSNNPMEVTLVIRNPQDFLKTYFFFYRQYRSGEDEYRIPFMIAPINAPDETGTAE